MAYYERSEGQEEAVESASSADEADYLFAYLFDGSAEQDWQEANRPAGGAEQSLGNVTLVDGDGGTGSGQARRRAESSEPRAASDRQETSEKAGTRSIHCDFSPEGVPLRLHHPDGTTDTFVWKDGYLAEIHNSSGYAWKFEFDKWFLYDANEKRTGDSVPFLQLVGGAEGQLHGRVTIADYKTLLVDMLQRQGSAAGDKQMSRASHETDTDVVKISTSVKAQAVETDASGRVTAVNYLDGRKRTFEYDKDIGALISVTDPYGLKLVRLGLTDKWKYEGQDDSKAREMLVKVDSEGNFTTRDLSGVDATVIGPDGSSNMDGRAERQFLSTDQFARRADGLFDRLDGNQDGFLDRQELADAMQDPSYQGLDAYTVAALYKSRELLQRLDENDEYFRDNDGITRNDLNAVGDVPRERREFVEGVENIKRILESPELRDAIDTDRDGMFSWSEMRQALNAPDTPESVKSALRHLDEHGVGRFRLFGFTMEDMQAYVDQVKFPKDEVIQAIEQPLALASDSLTAELSTVLYRNPDQPQKSISSDAVRQGGIGNCYFAAPLAAVADLQPEKIMQMIKKNGDGTYTVTFAGAPDKPVTVKEPTQAELALFNRGSQHGTWVHVLEKAFGEFRRQYDPERKLGGGGPSELQDLPAEQADGGGFSREVLKLLTGSDAADVEVSDANKDALRKALQEVFAGGEKKAVLAITPENPQGDSGRTADGFPTQHAYTILGFNPEGPGGGQITIRNPWGGADHTTSGIVTISLDEFIRNFSWLHVEK